MSSIHTNVLSDEELFYLNNRPEVILAKSELDSKLSGMVYFSIPITDLLRDTLNIQFGLNLPVDSKIPMRWIKGDIAPHIDVGQSKFENTYLVYLNDSPGEFIVDSKSYPIQNNTGFIFNEGLLHESKYTENVPRLLIGPMNELAEPVGRSAGIYYYSTEADASNAEINYSLGQPTLEIAYGGYNFQEQHPVYTVGERVNGNLNGYTSWRISSSSTGSSSKNIIYNNGSLLNPDNNIVNYNLYPSAPCFLEGSTILCEIDGIEKYVPVEELTPGTLVKTSLNGYKPVVLIGKGVIQNPEDNERTENRLYKCSTSNYPELKDDLYITGCHSILEFPITEKQKEDIIAHLGKLYVTDKKYRLMAFLDERAEPWNSKGDYTIWHFALENDDDGMNYGVYANGGLLVESCSIRFLKNKSNMELN
jgi:hypothetical protein